MRDTIELLLGLFLMVYSIIKMRSLSHDRTD